MRACMHSCVCVCALVVCGKLEDSHYHWHVCGGLCEVYCTCANCCPILYWYWLKLSRWWVGLPASALTDGCRNHFLPGQQPEIIRCKQSTAKPRYAWHCHVEECTTGCHKDKCSATAGLLPKQLTRAESEQLIGAGHDATTK